MSLPRRAAIAAAFTLLASGAYAAGAAALPGNVAGGDLTGYLRLVVLFASVSLAPVLLAVLTPFLRIIVVLYFLRAGLGSQQLLPNPVLMGLAILLTALSMLGPIRDLNQRALQPVLAGKLSPARAAVAAEPIARHHFEAHTRAVDLAAMLRYAPPGQNAQTAALPVLAAAYVLSELRAAFIIGFVIFLPFMVIDLVVAGTLASLGLTTMPQAMIALPFKILLLVMVDGWRLLADSLLLSLR